MPTFKPHAKKALFEKIIGGKELTCAMNTPQDLYD